MAKNNNVIRDIHDDDIEYICLKRILRKLRRKRWIFYYKFDSVEMEFKDCYYLYRREKVNSDSGMRDVDMEKRFKDVDVIIKNDILKSLLGI